MLYEKSVMILTLKLIFIPSFLILLKYADCDRLTYLLTISPHIHLQFTYAACKSYVLIDLLEIISIYFLCARGDDPDDYDKRFQRGGIIPIRMGDGHGTPGSNKAQNKAFADAVKKAGLDKDKQKIFHRLISGKNYSYAELLQEALDMAK